MKFSPGDVIVVSVISTEPKRFSTTFEGNKHQRKMAFLIISVYNSQFNCSECHDVLTDRGEVSFCLSIYNKNGNKNFYTLSKNHQDG